MDMLEERGVVGPAEGQGSRKVLAGALLLENDPTLTSDEVEACLKSSNAPITDAANGVTTPRVDALAALACLGPTSPIGGIVELPEAARVPLEADDTPDRSIALVAGIVATTVAAAASALGGLGATLWYARTRRPGR